MRRTLAPLLALGLVLASCDWFSRPSPEVARVVVAGEGGTPVRLIASTLFVASLDQELRTRVVVIEADTVVTTLPLDRTYSIRGDERFFVELSRLDTDVEEVRMRVLLDRRENFNEEGPLLEGAPYRFVYVFNQAIGIPVEVVY